MALDVQVLLRAERPAGGDLGHADLLLGHAEEGRDLTAVVPDALALGVDMRAAVAGHGQADSGSRKACSIALGTERLA